MRMKFTKGLSATAHWIQRILLVRMPMDAMFGVRSDATRR